MYFQSILICLVAVIETVASKELYIQDKSGGGHRRQLRNHGRRRPAHLKQLDLRINDSGAHCREAIETTRSREQREAESITIVAPWRAEELKYFPTGRSVSTPRPSRELVDFTNPRKAQEGHRKKHIYPPRRRGVKTEFLE